MPKFTIQATWIVDEDVPPASDELIANDAREAITNFYDEENVEALHITVQSHNSN